MSLVFCSSEVTVVVMGRKEVGKTTFVAHCLVSSDAHSAVIIVLLH